jgi:hypothetical protein
MSRPRGRPFASGNRFGRGRPRGSRNKSTVALQELLAEHGEALMKKSIVLALQGDRIALRLCLERLVPPSKQSPVQFDLPPIATAADLGRAQQAVLKALSRGQLTPAEATAIGALLENRRRMIESVDLEARLEVLEQRQREDAPHAA